MSSALRMSICIQEVEDTIKGLNERKEICGTLARALYSHASAEDRANYLPQGVFTLQLECYILLLFYYLMCPPLSFDHRDIEINNTEKPSLCTRLFTGNN